LVVDLPNPVLKLPVTPLFETSISLLHHQVLHKPKPNLKSPTYYLSITTNPLQH